MDEAAITQYITVTFEGVELAVASGNTFFFYDPGLLVAGGSPVLETMRRLLAEAHERAARKHPKARPAEEP